jgi:hypothetical protein
MVSIQSHILPGRIIVPDNAVPAMDYPQYRRKLLLRKHPPGSFLFGSAGGFHGRLSSSIAQAPDVPPAVAPAAGEVTWNCQFLYRYHNHISSSFLRRFSAANLLTIWVMEFAAGIEQM